MLWAGSALGKKAERKTNHQNKTLSCHLNGSLVIHSWAIMFATERRELHEGSSQLLRHTTIVPFCFAMNVAIFQVAE